MRFIAGHGLMVKARCNDTFHIVAQAQE